MKVLVTGSAGFIGSVVCRMLLSQGKDVLGLDNMEVTYDNRMKEWRARRMESIDNFEFIRGDITDDALLKNVFQDHEISAVINMAAKAGIRESVNEPGGFFMANTMGALNLLEQCRQNGVRKFVQASTCSVYGEASEVYTEDTPSDMPISPYGASKKATELLCYTYHHLHDMSIAALRFFTVYGPQGRPDMSIFRFIRWICEGEPVRVFGGSQSRNFVYVDDVARAILTSLDIDSGYEAINIGSSESSTIMRVIELIEDIVGKKARVSYEPANLSEPISTDADISKAASKLGWRPKVSLEKGLQLTIEWYMENRQWAQELHL